VGVPDDGRKRGNDGGEKYWRKQIPLLAIRKRGGGLSGYGEAEDEDCGNRGRRKKSWERERKWVPRTADRKEAF
jgi:hypothetical protein